MYPNYNTFHNYNPYPHPQALPKYHEKKSIGYGF